MEALINILNSFPRYYCAWSYMYTSVKLLKGNWYFDRLLQNNTKPYVVIYVSGVSSLAAINVFRKIIH